MATNAPQYEEPVKKCSVRLGPKEYGEPEPEILRRAQQQLDMLNSARELRDLRSPPGNRLELLRGDLEGFYSVRINNPWRLIFAWEAADAHDVRIVDYHRG